MEQHVHPENPNQVVFGKRLQAGETVRADDVYGSSSGIWEKAPFDGLVLQEGCTIYWVRPEKKI